MTVLVPFNHYLFLNDWPKTELSVPVHRLNAYKGNSYLLASQLNTRGTHLKEIEVSVELSAFGVLQPFELSRDEHENVLKQGRC